MAKAATNKLKSSWLTRFVVKAKVKVPTGVVLSPKETEALVDIQEKDVKVLKDNQQEVLSAIGVTYMKDTKTAIKKASAARSSAVGTYKQTKDPIKKREWARRIVVADETHKSLVSVTERMAATRERLEMIKGDIELQIIEAEVRVAETKAYAKAGKQLRLAGESLIDARTRAKQSKIEYSNLEVTMEGAEQLIESNTPDELLSKANEIAGIEPERN